MRILRMCIWVLVIAVAFGGFIHHRLEAQAQNMIQIKGSDSEVNLVQRLAEVFMQKNPGANIAVTGGGSGTGIAALINKTTDIANSSRDLSPKEEEEAKKAGVQPFRIIFAKFFNASIHPIHGISDHGNLFFEGFHFTPDFLVAKNHIGNFNLLIFVLVVIRFFGR